MLVDRLGDSFDRQTVTAEMEKLCPRIQWGGCLVIWCFANICICISAIVCILFFFLFCFCFPWFVWFVYSFLFFGLCGWFFNCFACLFRLLVLDPFYCSCCCCYSPIYKSNCNICGSIQVGVRSHLNHASNDSCSRNYAPLWTWRHLQGLWPDTTSATLGKIRIDLFAQWPPCFACRKLIFAPVICTTNPPHADISKWDVSRVGIHVDISKWDASSVGGTCRAWASWWHFGRGNRVVRGWNVSLGVYFSFGEV